MLAGGIAHDLNNILSPILGFTNLALAELPSGSPLKRDLEEVLRAARRARDLVQQILDFAQPRSEQQEPLFLPSLIEETLHFVRASLPSHIEIRSSTNPASGLIWANPARIQQVLMNLCINAGQAMEEKGGVLEVGLEPVDPSQAAALNLKPGPYCRLTVRDTGPGMDPEVIGRVFEPFFTTKAKRRGRGLGLATAHRIVTSLGGAITVESQKGKGSVFYVYLPCVQSAPTSEETTDQLFPQGKGRILFVDDEEAVALVGKRMLEYLGYEAVAQTSSLKALVEFRQAPQSFDAVVTDQTMPELTGEGLARELFKLRPDLPILVCTGFSTTLTPQRAKEVGFCAYLTKPFSIQELGEALKQALEAKKKG